MIMLRSEDGNIKLATEILESKLRSPQHGIFLFGGSPWGSNATKAMCNKQKEWAMSGFFEKIPILGHGWDMSRRNLLLYGRDHHDGRMLPLLPFVRRPYFSIACAAKKGLRHL